ncbi:hypothetical protein Rhe02_38110 [Rhizocola hellebori]|uniref:Uncharacterized protein n=1 Tax=Rhizocola hellebori TaxID=1392758 RepID=A0A8J3Q814_9ACTN|nr:hypothetical protein [Rhizocola hellebori]GIH05744.1 hypothetical protein Rhe02_38110 [Rhizocola hellebori]
MTSGQRECGSDSSILVQPRSTPANERQARGLRRIVKGRIATVPSEYDFTAWLDFLKRAIDKHIGRGAMLRVRVDQIASL